MMLNDELVESFIELLHDSCSNPATAAVRADMLTFAADSFEENKYPGLTPLDAVSAALAVSAAYVGIAIVMATAAGASEGSADAFKTACCQALDLMATQELDSSTLQLEKIDTLREAQEFLGLDPR